MHAHSQGHRADDARSDNPTPVRTPWNHALQHPTGCCLGLTREDHDDGGCQRHHGCTQADQASVPCRSACMAVPGFSPSMHAAQQGPHPAAARHQSNRSSRSELAHVGQPRIAPAPALRNLRNAACFSESARRAAIEPRVRPQQQLMSKLDHRIRAGAADPTGAAQLRPVAATSAISPRVWASRLADVSGGRAPRGPRPAAIRAPRTRGHRSASRSNTPGRPPGTGPATVTTRCASSSQATCLKPGMAAAGTMVRPA